MRCLPGFSNAARSREFVRASCGCCFHSCNLFSCLQGACSNARVAFWFCLATFVMASSRARVVLGVRPTFGTQVGFQPTAPCWDWDSGSDSDAWFDLCLLALAVSFPFLALSFALLAAVAKTVHIHLKKLKCSLQRPTRTDSVRASM